MSRITVQRERAEGEAALRPAAFLLNAMVAVLEGEPDRAIAITEDVYVRAGYLVSALAPEALERARVFMAEDVHSVRADVLEHRGAA